MQSLIKTKPGASSAQHDAPDVTLKVNSGGGEALRILVLAFESGGMMVRQGERRRVSGDNRAEVLE
ncbi:MAG: hypothetical protein NT013_07870, partial [Planctomycetia bacterium]|nr:hypothetical protein [Planctomycetia bacterium]